eukprot:6121851-Prymnesium_polylepis.1
MGTPVDAADHELSFGAFEHKGPRERTRFDDCAATLHRRKVLRVVPVVAVAQEEDHGEGHQQRRPLQRCGIVNRDPLASPPQDSGENVQREGDPRRWIGEYPRQRRVAQVFEVEREPTW